MCLEFACGLVYAFIDLSCSYINTSKIESPGGIMLIQGNQKADFIHIGSRGSLRVLQGP